MLDLLRAVRPRRPQLTLGRSHPAGLDILAHRLSSGTIREVPDDRTRRFYDELAADYHLIFADWDASMARQGRALDHQIVDKVGPHRRAVLDCACGIGTQSLALAKLGYEVVGADLS